VQGGSVVKPLTGVRNDGPSDAAVVMPVLGESTGFAVGNGLNPRYADLDPGAAADLGLLLGAASVDCAPQVFADFSAEPDVFAYLTTG